MAMNILSEYRRDLEAARSRIARMGGCTAETRLGPIEFLDCGQGQPVLVVHGVVGGFDHGPGMAETYLGPGFRTICVSRFGYVGSPMAEDASPQAQADRYAALLDGLGIERVAVAGTSAATASCLHFALRHPQRCTALVLWSMAVPPYPVPPTLAASSMRAFFGSNFAFWVLIRYFPALMLKMMGVPEPIQKRLTPEEREMFSSAMDSFLPINLRVNGIMNDVHRTNPGMNDLPVEQIGVPTLITHAVDDPMPPFAGAKEIAGRITGAEFVQVNEGGHLLLGRIEQVRANNAAFIRQYGRG